MTSILTATDWIIETLKADTALAAIVGSRVFLGPIPPQVKPETPYVVVTKIPGQPLTNDMGDVIWFDDLVDVDAWDENPSPGRVAGVIDLVIPLLHKSSGTHSSGSVVACTFEGENPAIPAIDGLTIEQHRGAEFRVKTQ